MVTPVVILRRVLPKPGVDVETLFAVVDVYIISGMIFATLFIGIAQVSARRTRSWPSPATTRRATTCT